MDFVVSKLLCNAPLLNTTVNVSFCRSSNYSILVQVFFFFFLLKIVEMDQPRGLNMNYVWHFYRKNVYISEKNVLKILFFRMVFFYCIPDVSLLLTAIDSSQLLYHSWHFPPLSFLHFSGLGENKLDIFNCLKSYFKKFA